MTNNDVPYTEYLATKEKNKELLKENVDLKLQIEFLTKKLNNLLEELHRRNNDND